jgi:hypothetical protein
MAVGWIVFANGTQASTTVISANHTPIDAYARLTVGLGLGGVYAHIKINFNAGAFIYDNFVLGSKTAFTAS